MKKGVNKDKALSIVSPVDFVQNALYNPIESYQNYIYPMILQQTMLIGASMLGGTQREFLHGVNINENGKIYLKKINSIQPNISSHSERSEESFFNCKSKKN